VVHQIRPRLRRVGTSFQVVVAAGAEAEVRAAVAAAGQEASAVAIGEQRWAVLPVTSDEGYAETDELARLASSPAGAVAASIQVFDSDGPADETAVATALTATSSPAEDQFHQLLHALNLRPVHGT
jgi:hypothetical protein